MTPPTYRIADISPRNFQPWIDGAWAACPGAPAIERRSPGHDVPVSSWPETPLPVVRQAIRAARRAFDAGAWPSAPGAERAACLLRAAGEIRRRKEELALVECLESGKPITQARDEMDWAAGLWDYAATLARQLHGEAWNTLGAQMLGLTVREPVGVVGLITPWNFPLLIISQKLPFALAAGCTAVVKPSEFTSGTTLLLGEILQAAGLPDGVVNIVTGEGPTVGAALCSSEEIDMISFTGSTAAGKLIAAAAQQSLKKVSLELGGKNPQIVFPDADLEAAADAVVFGVLFNAGQCCNSGSRLLVHQEIADAFVARVVRLIGAVRVGDPLDPATKVGAIVNQRQFDKILELVATAAPEGGACVLGGAPLPGPGRFIQPTVLDHVPPAARVAREEIFGPVLSVLRFKTTAEALQIANDTPYGLSAGVWTRNLDDALTLARGIRAGTVWVNTFMEGPAELPFGGTKQSGIGRELGPQAALEYTETKAIQLHTGPRTSWWARPQ